MPRWVDTWEPPKDSIWVTEIRLTEDDPQRRAIAIRLMMRACEGRPFDEEEWPLSP